MKKIMLKAGIILSVLLLLVTGAKNIITNNKSIQLNNSITTKGMIVVNATVIDPDNEK